MNYYMYVPYFLTISPCQLTDYEYRHSYPYVNICYNYSPYFNDSFYSVPLYPETEYQVPNRRSRKEKSMPLKNFLTPKNAPTTESAPTGILTPESVPTDTPTTESAPTNTPTTENTSMGPTVPWIPFSKNLTPINSLKGGPYGDITKEIESINKFK